jgi:hypothetical protein
MPNVLRENEQLAYICGTTPDPSGRDPNLIGHESKLDFTKSALGHPLIRWRDKVIEADVYLDGEELVVHIICPKCSTPDVPHGLHIRASQKGVEYDAKTNTLSVEPFTCSWELPEGRRQEFGIGMCKWRVAIDKNFAREV